MQNRFKQIVERYLLNTSNLKDRKVVDDFVDNLQKKPFISLKEVQDNSVLRNVIYSRIKYKTRGRKKRKPYNLAIGCIALLLVGLSIYILPEGKSSSNYYITSNDEAKTIDLLDGSTVKLSANSSLTISNNFNDSERNVLLKGEAFFNVAKDTSRPFVIISDNFETSVLGTSFLVNEKMVAVSMGRVKVSKVLDKENCVFLNKDEKVWFLNDRFYKNSTDVLSSVSSNSPILLMNNIAISEWKNLMEEEFGIVILFEDETEVNDLLIKGDFRNSTLRDIVQSISFVYRLDFKYENNKLIINNYNK